jgi:hypothetical protein
MAKGPSFSARPITDRWWHCLALRPLKCVEMKFHLRGPIALTRSCGARVCLGVGECELQTSVLSSFSIHSSKRTLSRRSSSPVHVCRLLSAFAPNIACCRCRKRAGGTPKPRKPGKGKASGGGGTRPVPTLPSPLGARAGACCCCCCCWWWWWCSCWLLSPLASPAPLKMKGSSSGGCGGGGGSGGASWARGPPACSWW